MFYHYFISFFFNYTPATEIYPYLHTLSPHDALPISASGKYKKYDPVAVDGSEVAANAVILYADTPLLAAHQKATIDVRDGAVNGNALTWAIAVDDTQRNAVIAGMAARSLRSEEHTSELQSLMRISYAVFCLKKKTTTTYRETSNTILTTN